MGGCVSVNVSSLSVLLRLTPGRQPLSASALQQGCPSGVHSPGGNQTDTERERDRRRDQGQMTGIYAH